MSNSIKIKVPTELSFTREGFNGFTTKFVPTLPITNDNDSKVAVRRILTNDFDTYYLENNEGFVKGVTPRENTNQIQRSICNEIRSCLQLLRRPLHPSRRGA